MTLTPEQRLTALARMLADALRQAPKGDTLFEAGRALALNRFEQDVEDRTLTPESSGEKG